MAVYLLDTDTLSLFQRGHPVVTANVVQLVRLRLNVGGYDLRTAAIALEAGGTVVTRNHRDFGRVSGLAVVNWSV